MAGIWYHTKGNHVDDVLAETALFITQMEREQTMKISTLKYFLVLAISINIALTLILVNRLSHNINDASPQDAVSWGLDGFLNKYNHESNSTSGVDPKSYGVQYYLQSWGQNFRAKAKAIVDDQLKYVESAKAYGFTVRFPSDDKIDYTPVNNSNSTINSISACILVNDENPRLPEWLAYHYQNLPLRSLVVTIDPNSRYHPFEILSRWRSMGMDIEIWDQSVYLATVHLRTHGKCDATISAKKCHWKHRTRQTRFISRCLLEYKKRGGKWVLLTDVDEYLVFNQIHDDDPAVKNGGDGVDPIAPRRRLPSLQRGITILDVLEKELRQIQKQGNVPTKLKDSPSMSSLLSGPCISIPRILFGSRESTLESNWTPMAPHPFKDDDFVTLRYRWHTERGAFNGNKYPKTLIDVTRVSEEDIGIKAPSIHNPIEKYCIPDPPHYSLSLFRVVSLVFRSE